MAETNKTLKIFSDPFRSELEEIVERAIKKALNGNGHHNEDYLLNTKRAANHLGVAVSWVREKARRGDLPCVHLGHYLRFKPEDLDQYIKDHRK